MVAIERESSQDPWTRDELEQVCLHRVALVYELHGKAVGYIIAACDDKDTTERRIEILNIAVDPFLRLQGIGSLLVRRVIAAARETGASVVAASVRERNTVALMFLRKLGFKSTTMIRGFYQETDEAAVRMAYRIGDNAAASPAR